LTAQNAQAPALPHHAAHRLQRLAGRSIHTAQQRAALAVNRELVRLYWHIGRANLMYMRAFAEAWPDEAIVQQAVGQLPWGHNLVLLTKLKNPDLRLAYAQRTIEHGWSRNALEIHIETRRLEREGRAITNFTERLPAPDTDLARQSLSELGSLAED
jgi:predicted nuclease of restriction endonuclease-like (RecB) superfamily